MTEHHAIRLISGLVASFGDHSHVQAWEIIQAALSLPRSTVGPVQVAYGGFGQPTLSGGAGNTTMRAGNGPDLC